MERDENAFHRLEKEDAYLIPDLVKDGLEVICICHKGNTRSPFAAKELSENGHPAVFIPGGFNDITNMDEKSREKLFEQITQAPYLLILLDYDYDLYQDVIASIRRGEGTIAVCPSVDQFIENYLPR